VLIETERVFKASTRILQNVHQVSRQSWRGVAAAAEEPIGARRLGMAPPAQTGPGPRRQTRHHRTGTSSFRSRSAREVGCLPKRAGPGPPRLTPELAKIARDINRTDLTATIEPIHHTLAHTYSPPLLTLGERGLAQGSNL
jgi:hypothetical protein